MKRDLTAFRRGWTRVWGKCLGGIWLIPSESIATIVQYTPEIRISCVLAPKKRTVVGDLYKGRLDLRVEAEIEIPLLLWSQYLYVRPSCSSVSGCICPSCDPVFHLHHTLCYCEKCFQWKAEKFKNHPHISNFLNYYSLYALKSLEDIRVNVLRFPNVDSEGKICFGANRPKTLRAANNIFWSAPFNNDYGYQKPAHKNCQKRKHLYNYSPHFNKHKTNCLTCRRQVEHPHCKCPKKDVNIHLVVCSCYEYCRCPCMCVCCKETCACICGCHCCLNVCACPCACNLTSEFIQLIEQSVRNAQTGFYDFQPKIAGKGFLSTNKAVSGVFITFDPKTLVENKNSVQQTAAGRVIVGLATRNDQDQWIIDLEKNNSLTLEDKEVHVL